MSDETKRVYQRFALTREQERYLLKEIQDSVSAYRIDRDPPDGAAVAKARVTLKAWDKTRQEINHKARVEWIAMQKAAIEAVLFAESVNAARKVVSEYKAAVKKRGWSLQS